MMNSWIEMALLFYCIWARGKGGFEQFSSLVFMPQVGVYLKHVLGGMFPESLKSVSLLNERAVSAFSQSPHPQNTLLTVD